MKHHEWRSIQDEIDNKIAKRGEYFDIVVVTKRDDENKLVWADEYGSTAIPLVAFDVSVKYYDTISSGAVVPRMTRPPRGTNREVEIITPQVGESILVGKILGSNGFPVCLGVIQGRNFTPVGDD